MVCPENPGVGKGKKQEIYLESIDSLTFPRPVVLRWWMRSPGARTLAGMAVSRP